MNIQVRAYDVEPNDKHSPLPDWVLVWWEPEEVPSIGDELVAVDAPGTPDEGETHYWRVVGRSCEPSPVGGSKYILRVRFIS